MWNQARKFKRLCLLCVTLFVVCSVVMRSFIGGKCGFTTSLKKAKYQIASFFGIQRLSKEKRTIINENVTVITAFWDLGSFRKGTGSLEYSPRDYKTWASVFEKMTNPLIVYTDSWNFKLWMEHYREYFSNKTKLIFTKRDEFWSFQILKNIKLIFDQPDYPNFYPNTVLPEYSACQHTKFAVVADALRQNIFRTEFYAWLDVGYFRDATCDEDYFQVNPPSGIDKTRLSANKVHDVPTNVSLESIFKENRVWVGGGMLIGTKDVFLKFEKLYKRAVKFFIKRKLMNSDQQVIYGIYSTEGRKHLAPDVELQLYSPADSHVVITDNVWFHLGYMCHEYV